MRPASLALASLALASLALAVAPAAQDWVPTSVDRFEIAVDSSGTASPLRLDLEAGELVELDLDYGYRPDTLRLAGDDGATLVAIRPPSRIVRQTVIAPQSGTYVLTSRAPFGPGSARATASRFGVGVLETVSGELSGSLEDAGRHDFAFAPEDWIGTEWWKVVVEVEADAPAALEVVRVTGDTLRAEGRVVSVGPFTHTSEIEFKDGPIRVWVRPAQSGSPVPYTVRVRRWAYTLESAIPPPPPPPSAESNGLPAP